MTVHRTRRLALAAAVALSAVGTALATLPAAQGAPAAASKPKLVNCSGIGTVKPKGFIITCADAGDSLTKLKWSNWSTTASGKGTDVVNDCKPNCAEGHFHKYGVDVSLFRVKPWSHHAGQRYYTRMGLTYTGKVPHGFHRHRTVNLWATKI
ncbi:MAG TPA: hypothetical protein VGM14_20240 [Streptosporangiaceae bacterium]